MKESSFILINKSRDFRQLTFLSLASKIFFYIFFLMFFTWCFNNYLTIPNPLNELFNTDAFTDWILIEIRTFIRWSIVLTVYIESKFDVLYNVSFLKTIFKIFNKYQIQNRSFSKFNSISLLQIINF